MGEEEKKDQAENKKFSTCATEIMWYGRNEAPTFLGRNGLFSPSVQEKFPAAKEAVAKSKSSSL